MESSDASDDSIDNSPFFVFAGFSKITFREGPPTTYLLNVLALYMHSIVFGKFRNMDPEPSLSMKLEIDNLYDRIQSLIIIPFVDVEKCDAGISIMVTNSEEAEDAIVMLKYLQELDIVKPKTYECNDVTIVHLNEKVNFSGLTIRTIDENDHDNAMKSFADHMIYEPDHPSLDIDGFKFTKTFPYA
jgi:hypothetical protein